ncbi:hypothetical protein P8935_10165 [Telmatobacter sp. DSM 110680]|uniref:Uncharacterized protein n=1 Tax=Telmatobacter sp. DSM 110680 TaxID=3036704 RepID=A0AAU7DQX2_9BACT
MELAEAWDRVQRILLEERVRPTVSYRDRVDEWRQENQGKLFDEEMLEITRRWSKLYMNPRPLLSKDRECRPRHVHEFPGEYVFRSENFNLLTIIYVELSLEDRASLMSFLTQLLSSRSSSRKSENKDPFPSFRNYISEFPLLAEFIVRHGHAQELFETLSSLAAPTIPLVTLFLELEEMIALNFTLFSDEELKAIPRKLQPLLEHFGKIVKAGTFNSTRGHAPSDDQREQGQIARGICDSIGGLLEECRTARHYYLKEELLNENPNLDIESDKKKLTDSLSKLGFHNDLIATLRKAENLYKPTSDAFDLKNCIGLIRSFIERLHTDSAATIAGTMQTTVADEWNPSTQFLRNNRIITEQQDKLARGLYAVLSDEGVHPVMAKREFCRLARNMVIEYGVMFLSILEQKGIKIS